MKLVIDASNIKSGGGLTHLIELLRNVNPLEYGFDEIFLYSSQSTLDQIEDQSWLSKKSHRWLERGYLHRFIWMNVVLSPFVRKEKCLLFIPGTGYSRNRYVTMCRNLLPIDPPEIKRYFLSANWFRLKLLSIIHKKAYAQAEKIIFLNSFCQKRANISDSKSVIIPHGLSEKFKLSIEKKFDQKRALNLLYISTVDEYKHQWVIAEAIYLLNLEGYDVTLNLIGNAYPKSLRRLEKVMTQFEDIQDKVIYHGFIPYDRLPEFYSSSDVFIFGSTCETFGMVLLEAMGAGLPVICSNKSSMPEMVLDSAIYMDPETTTDIMEKVKLFYGNTELLKEFSIKSKKLSSSYCWKQTSEKTMDILAEVSKEIFY